MKDVDGMVVYDILEKAKELGQNITDMLEYFDKNIASISDVTINRCSDQSFSIKIEVKI
jgi:hypothetical protein